GLADRGRYRRDPPRQGAPRRCERGYLRGQRGGYPQRPDRPRALRPPHGDASLPTSPARGPPPVPRDPPRDQRHPRRQRGARAALITTRGFRDVLELRRSARADLYDLFQDAPATLIPRRRRFEITERIGADGAVVTPLAENEIDGLVAALKAARVDAVAIS